MAAHTEVLPPNLHWAVGQPPAQAIIRTGGDGIGYIPADLDTIIYKGELTIMFSTAVGWFQVSKHNHCP